MSFKKYLLDKTVQITVSIVGFIIAILMLNAFKVENDLKIAFTILFFQEIQILQKNIKYA